jgi:hypothetical protein
MLFKITFKLFLSQHNYQELIHTSPCNMHVASLGFFSTLKMEMIFAYETSNITKTNFTEPGPSSDVTSRSAAQEFPNVLRNLNVHYPVHNSPPLLSILNQINPDHTTPSYFSKIILILSSHLRLGLPSGLSPSDFFTGTLYRFSFLQCGLHDLPISSSLT